MKQDGENILTEEEQDMWDTLSMPLTSPFIEGYFYCPYIPIFLLEDKNNGC